MSVHYKKYGKKARQKKVAEDPDYDRRRNATPLARAQRKAYYERNKVKMQEQARARKRYNRKASIRALGGKCQCPGCDVKDWRFLTIDHVNRDGKQHREELHGSIYDWMQREGFPSEVEGLQVLCMNCNWARERGWTPDGICPHLYPDKD